MHMLNGKNLPNYRLRGIGKFATYMSIRMAPSILLTTALFLWALQVLWNQADWKNVFGDETNDVAINNYSSSLLVAQNVVMFASVYYLALTSASFHNHTNSILQFSPAKNAVWLVCACFALVFQIVFFAISLAVTSNYSALSILPWYFYVVLFVWAFALIIIDELMKKQYKKWFKRFQLELRLEFDTKLGMHSPI
eukprot:TRINITY_DN3988_c0_g1_i1.p1 TRINITY_DN3988_c0_g1~~TRINITY_DN3988_c0_g1_i1.p1  ORF type:complete len:195 (-),score=23.21 TRINITY_DN3988_c0_g1_i1:104-688(-)